MAAASGIVPTNDTLNLVDEVRKNNSKLAFATFKVENVSIIPDYQFPNGDEGAEVTALKAQGDSAYAAGFEKTVWPAFVKKISSGGPRFAVIDFVRSTADGRIVKTLVSIGWCPDRGTPAREKMTFASTKTAFEVKINIGKKYQANDESDLEYAQVLEAISK